MEQAEKKVVHTSQNSFYKWTKISSHDIDIFDFDGEKWSRTFYFKIHRAPSELLLPNAKISAQNG